MVACLTVALSFAIYAPSITSQFVSDDRLAITGNELVTLLKTTSLVAVTRSSGACSPRCALALAPLAVSAPQRNSGVGTALVWRD